MKGKQEIKAILLGIGMGLLAMPSCSDDVINPDRPENGAIMLQVGVSNSPAQQPLTRAAGDTYVALSPNTKFKLRVQGTWTGKDPSEIIKETTATAGAERSFADGTENPLTFDPVLFWDDYGTGDPANAETGRKNGLDILAVAVDNEKTTAMAISETEWKGTKSWTLQTDGKKVLTGDILVANNLSDGKDPGRLTFANRNDKEKSRLIFQHLMSKITFNLTPADGFMQTGGKYAFKASPTVELNRNRYKDGALPSGGDYALVEGTISIRDAKATPSPTSMKKITAGDETKKEEGGAEVRTQVALVYPGTCLGETDNDVVARIAADNNYYYVTAKEIRAAIDNVADHRGVYNTKAGYNYIINVTVKKTGVNVTATVTNWVNVEAEEASPVIALTAGAGSTGETGDWATTGVDSFDFFRSTAKLKGYSDETLLKENDCYKPLRKVKWETTSGTTSPRACVFYDNNTGATPTPLYWPDHDTHYHFRGVYPATTTAESVTEPQVKTYGSGANAEQGIAVQNGVYDKTKFPSNLMIGMPEIAKGTQCGSGEHTQEDMSEKGICARSGKINMNFRYMMSQVEIELAHSLTEGTEGKVTLDENTTVEIVGGYIDGYIRLGDRKAVGQTKNSYTTTVDASDAKKLKRHDIVLPQDLAGMQFKITVDNTDGTHDYYYATIQDIPVRVGEGAKESITKWESGKHYKYTLKLKKTAMEITATLTDWITVEADEDIWM